MVNESHWNSLPPFLLSFFIFLFGKLQIYINFRRILQYTPDLFHLDLFLTHSLFFNHWKVFCRHHENSLLNISVHVKLSLVRIPLLFASLHLREQVSIPPPVGHRGKAERQKDMGSQQLFNSWIIHTSCLTSQSYSYLNHLYWTSTESEQSRFIRPGRKYLSEVPESGTVLKRGKR